MGDSRNIARPVESEKEITRLRAEFSTRPLRLAFVIRDDLALDHLAAILEYNSYVWGGYYNSLIPTDGEKIVDDWWSHLMHHRPDKVVFCGDKGEPAVSPVLFREVQDRLQPFALHEWVSL